MCLGIDRFILGSSQVEWEEEGKVCIVSPPPVMQPQNTHATSAAKISKRKGSSFLHQIMITRKNKCLEKTS